MTRDNSLQRRNRMDLEALAGRRGNEDKHAIKWGDLDEIARRISLMQINGSVFDTVPLEKQTFEDTSGTEQNLVNYLMGTRAVADGAATDAQQALTDAAAVQTSFDALVTGFSGTIQSAITNIINSEIPAQIDVFEASYFNATTGQVLASALSSYYTIAGANAAITAAVESFEAEFRDPTTGQIKASALTSYYTSAQTDSAISSSETALQSSIDAVSANLTTNYYTITQTDSAIAASATTLQSNIDGVSSTVTTQGAAITDLQGNASAGYLIKAQAGGAVSLIDLVAADGSGAPSSIAKVSAEDIILDGTTSTKKLIVGDFSGNLVGNGAFQYGDLRGWSGYDASYVSASSFGGKKCMAFSYSQYSTKYADWYDQPAPVVEGDILSVKFKACLSDALGSAGVSIGLLFYDAADAFLTSAYIEATPSSTVWEESSDSVTVPAGAVYVKPRVRRHSGGSHTAYMTDIEVLRKRPGTTLITPNSITTSELNVAGDISALGLTAQFANITGKVSASQMEISNPANASRIEILDNKILIYNSGVLRVKIGDLT